MDQTKPIAMTSQHTVVSALQAELKSANRKLKLWETEAITDIALGTSDSTACQIWNDAHARRKAILIALEGRQTPAPITSELKCNNGLGKAKSQFTARLNGYEMTFANGWTVSVKFGARNYCENKYEDYDQLYNNGVQTTVRSRQAEIAAWDADENWYDFGSDDVKGYQTTEQVADFIDMVRNF